jgi:hypothetical protein
VSDDNIGSLARCGSRQGAGMPLHRSLGDSPRADPGVTEACRDRACEAVPRPSKASTDALAACGNRGQKPAPMSGERIVAGTEVGSRIEPDDADLVARRYERIGLLHHPWIVAQVVGSDETEPHPG